MSDLTNEQKKFVDMVDSMYTEWTKCIKGNKPFSCMLLLNAPGGTGKTFILKHLWKKYPVRIIAPTHKAVSIFGKENIPASTIHKFLHAEDDYSETGELEYSFKAPPVGKYIIIADEASMISKSMFNELKKISGLVIFAGDKSQINPVNEIVSPVFAKIPKKNTFTLTKNMRVTLNPDSMSANYLAAFREATTENPLTMRPIRVTRKPNEFMLEQFKKESDVVVLAWTNSRVVALNESIRTELYCTGKDKTLKPYYVGEKMTFSGFRRVMVHKPTEDDSDYDTGDDSVYDYYSSDIITISKIKEVVLRVPFATCSHNGIDPKKVVACEECDIAGHKSTHSRIRFYVLTDQNGVTWNMPFTEDQSRLARILQQHKKASIKAKSVSVWRSYYDFVNTYNPNLNYTYAMTVHKAQGSEYSIVFVDIDNIRYNRNPEEQARLAYTAVSRYRKYVFFI